MESPAVAVRPCTQAAARTRARPRSQRIGRSTATLYTSTGGSLGKDRERRTQVANPEPRSAFVPQEADGQGARLQELPGVQVERPQARLHQLMVVRPTEPIFEHPPR